MFLDRRTDPGELTVTVEHDVYLRLLRRAAEHGLTPEAFVERLARDAFDCAMIVPRTDGVRRDPTS